MQNVISSAPWMREESSPARGKGDGGRGGGRGRGTAATLPAWMTSGKGKDKGKGKGKGGRSPAAAPAAAAAAPSADSVLLRAAPSTGQLATGPGIRYMGVSQPINTDLPTPADEKWQAELDNFLHSHHRYEDKSGKQLRESVLGAIQQILVEVRREAAAAAAARTAVQPRAPIERERREKKVQVLLCHSRPSGRRAAALPPPRVPRLSHTLPGPAALTPARVGCSGPVMSAST